MDPTANLEAIRMLVRKIDTANKADRAELAIDLADLIDALDGWISRGSFLPRQWRYDSTGLER